METPTLVGSIEISRTRPYSSKINGNEATTLFPHSRHDIPKQKHYYGYGFIMAYDWKQGILTRVSSRNLVQVGKLSEKVVAYDTWYIMFHAVFLQTMY